MLAVPNKLSDALCSVCRHLGRVYLRQGCQAKAVSLLQRAIALRQEVEDPEHYVLLVDRVRAAFWSRNVAYTRRVYVAYTRGPHTYIALSRCDSHCHSH